MSFTTLKFALNALPRSVRYPIIKHIVARPQRLPPPDSDFMRTAKRISYGNQRNKIGWSAGTGPLVVCIHGWGGSGGADMGHIAGALVDAGFHVVAIDMTAHGESPGKSIGFGQFITDISEFSAGLTEPVYGYVGFSAGGLSMMAARSQGHLSAPKYVCISTPHTPYPPLVLLQKKLGIDNQLQQRFQKYLAGEFTMDWEDITATCFRGRPGESLQLIYDTSDTFIHHSDGDKIQAAWPEAQLIKTAQNKHREMPQSRTVITEIVRFISDRAV